MDPAPLAQAHRLVEPQGWDNQLRNEPAVNLMVDHQWRYYGRLTTLGLGTDVTPHVGGALGNVFTYAATGATLRIGRDIGTISADRPASVRPPRPGRLHARNSYQPNESLGVKAAWPGRAGLMRGGPPKSSSMSLPIRNVAPTPA